MATAELHFFTFFLACFFLTQTSRDGGFFVSLLSRSRRCIEYSHQDAITKGTAGPPPLLNFAALKLTHSSAARSRSKAEIFEPLGYIKGNNLLRDQDSTNICGWPSMDFRVTTVRRMFFFPMEMCDEGMTRCETKVASPPPPFAHFKNVWITRSCFLLVNGEETQLKNEAERCDKKKNKTKQPGCWNQ